MVMRSRRLVLALVLVSCVPPSVTGQAPAQQPAFAPTDSLPFDSAVVRGTLPNGLTYYIRRNGRPEKRVMLELAVKTGSVDETDEQQGLAHSLEHMAFNGSRNFEAGELIKALESTGYERAYSEREKGESGSYAREYVSHFLHGEPAPGIELEYRLAQSLIPAITAAEVGEMAKTPFADTARVIIATSPQKQGLAVPTEAQLRDAIVRADEVAVMPWKDAGTGRALVDTLPDPGDIKDRREVPELGVTVVRFANGVEALTTRRSRTSGSSSTRCTPTASRTPPSCSAKKSPRSTPATITLPSR